MSEEEKQVIEEVQYFITNGIDEARPFPIDDWCEILLSIIEKQQKEIENSISKYKIIEKLKELKQEGSYFSNGYYDSGAKLILEELLEE